MARSQLPVSLSEIEKALQGPRLPGEIARTFEEACVKFLQHKDKREHMEEVVQDIANLLTISQKNLEEVQNQNWFQRAWKTITGHNKRLERINHANLLMVQRGALLFLQNLAEVDFRLIETVAWALKRVEDIQFESIKFKGYLVQVVQKYNQKLRNLERKVDTHEQAIAELQRQGKSLTLFWMTACGSFLAALTSLYVMDEPRQAWIAVLVLTTMGIASLTYAFIAHRRTSRASSTIPPSQPTTSATQQANLELRPQLNKAFQSCIDDYIRNHVVESILAEFSTRYQVLDQIYQQLGISELTGPQLARIIRSLLEVEPVSLNSIELATHKAASEFCEFHRELVSTIHQEYLPDSIGVDVLCSLDSQFQRDLADKLFKPFLPYAPHFEAIVDMRNLLFEGNNRFNRLMHESGVVKFGKALLEILTLGIWSTDDEEFLEDFCGAVDSYFQQWENLSVVLHNSVLELCTKVFEDAVSHAVSKLQPFLDQFDEKDMSIKPLLDWIQELNGTPK